MFIPKKIVWVNRSNSVQSIAEILKSEIVAIDTEFVREKTFLPLLGLIQIATVDSIYLIDPLDIDLLSLVPLLQNDSIKIFYSCAEDIEVLYHNTLQLPKKCFDLQIAATFIGYWPPPGYSTLVNKYFNIAITKETRRTNWLQRPLSTCQLTYASLDVAYLIPLFRLMRKELLKLDRFQWVFEETELFLNVERFLPTPQNAWRRIKGGLNLTGKNLAILQKLAEWREEKARKKNLPRPFIMKDKDLLKLAKNFSGKDSKNREIVAVISKIQTDHHQNHTLEKAKMRWKMFEKKVASVAEELNLPINLILRKEIKDILLRYFETPENINLLIPIPRWRKIIITPFIKEVLNET